MCFCGVLSQHRRIYDCGGIEKLSLCWPRNKYNFAGSYYLLRSPTLGESSIHFFLVIHRTEFKSFVKGEVEAGNFQLKYQMYLEGQFSHTLPSKPDQTGNNTSDVGFQVFLFVLIFRRFYISSEQVI